MAAKTTTSKTAARGTKKPSLKAAAQTAPAKLSRATAQPSAAKATGKATTTSTAPATVTAKHLSAELGERHAMAKKQADTVVADGFEMLVTHLKSGDRVRIGGLGILEVKSRPARMGRNPATGEAIQIKASKKVAFRTAKELKDAI